MAGQNNFQLNDADNVVDALALALYEALVHMQPYQNAIPYARTSADQMRVNVDSGGSLVTYTYWGNQNTEPTYYSSGAANSMDAREQMALASEQNFNIIRQGRWVIS